MKQKKIVMIVTAVLLAITAIAAVIWLNIRPTVSEGDIVLVKNGTEQILDLSGLTLTDIDGTIVNGKGEERRINGKGVHLSDMIGASGFVQVRFAADDEYFAVVQADELDNAWLLISDDSARLIVFGDSNAKRDVKNVVRIEVI
ncbi:MAG: hypothetical protein IK990_10435 [Ruminiclostridium sp.]|nr:hypothetical protein [Ruminiclostridium sp.]